VSFRRRRNLVGCSGGSWTRDSLCRAVPDVDALGDPTDAAEHSIRLEVIKLRASIDAPPALLSSHATFPRLSGAHSPSSPGASIERIRLTGTMSETVIDNRYVAAAAVATEGDTRAVPHEHRRAVTSSHIKSSPARSARCGCWCRSLLCQWCGPRHRRRNFHFLNVFEELGWI
jgi:hypothetical protein